MLQAKEEYQKFVSRVQRDYIAEKVNDGIFGAMMDVQLVNDVRRDPQPSMLYRRLCLALQACISGFLIKRCLQGPVTMSFDSELPGGR